MPVPRVFVSSTCYDLHYIRENLAFFIKSMGFEPVLSEKGNVTYPPAQSVQDAVLEEVANCQLFVLIIGGRFGSKFKDKSESVVNYEYRRAIEKAIPVFALVEASVYHEYKFFIRNRQNKISSQILYSEVDSPKIFGFIEEVESNAFNNALFPFSNIIELESYLRQQWAGLMYNLLAKKSAYEKESELVEKLSHVEFLTKQLLNSFGQDPEKIDTILYDKLSQSELKKIEKNMRIKFSIADIIESKTVDELFDKSGIIVNKHAQEVELIPSNKGFSATVPLSYFDNLNPDYNIMRKELLNTLDQFGWSVEKYLNQVRAKNGKK